MASFFSNFPKSARRAVCAPVGLAVVGFWVAVGPGASRAGAQDAARPVPGSSESADLFPPTAEPPPSTALGVPPVTDDPLPPGDARHPWEEDIATSGALRPAPAPDRQAPPTFRAVATPAEIVADHGAAAFDPTAAGFGRGLPGGTFTANPNPPIQVGPFAFKGSAGVSLLAEKESGDGERAQGWRAGTRLFGTLNASVGQPSMNRYLELQYAGSYQIGGRAEYDGTFDQAVALTGHYDFAQLKLRLTGDYSHTTGPDRDVGLTTSRDLVALRLDATYPVSLLSSLNWNLGESTSDYAHDISSTEVRTSLFFDRQISVKTRLGLGGTFGTLQVEEGDNQTFEQVNLRGTYVPTNTKFSLAATVGYEFRQVGGTDTGTPVFDGSVAYAVRPTTRLSLAAGRSVTDSAVAAQTNYVSSTVRLSLTQKINARFVTSLSLGYQNADYRFAEGATARGREDDFVFVRPDLTWLAKDFFSVFLLYSYGENFSDQRGFQTQEVSLGARGSF